MLHAMLVLFLCRYSDICHMFVTCIFISITTERGSCLLAQAKVAFTLVLLERLEPTNTLKWYTVFVNPQSAKQKLQQTTFYFFTFIF